jgi:myo-inositol-1(or 4)-monophosphatase
MAAIDNQVTPVAQYRGRVNSSQLRVLHECANEIGEAVKAHRGRGLSGDRATQYHLDVAADDVARRVLGGAGFRIMSEESGVTGDGEFTVVIDPIDGSTNCDRGIPFYSTSLAVLRDHELVAALVKNQATGTVYVAEKGSGARRDGVAISPSGETVMAKTIVGSSGYPSHNLGWWQNRSLGAASLEICLVADGSLDVYGVAQHSGLNVWDYLGGLLIVREAGAFFADYLGEELVTTDDVIRHPVFAGSRELLTFMLDAGTI